MAHEKKYETKHKNELETSPSSITTAASSAAASVVGGDLPKTNWMDEEVSKTKENNESMISTTTEEATPITTNREDTSVAIVPVLEGKTDIGTNVELNIAPFKDKMGETVDCSTNDSSDMDNSVIIHDVDNNEEEIVFSDQESSPIQGVDTTRFSEDNDTYNKTETLDVPSLPPVETLVGESDPPSSSSSSSSFGVGILQVMALVRKNLLVKYRTPTATFFELFSPLLMILILSAAFSLSEVIEKDAKLYTSITIDLPGPWMGLVQNAWIYLQQQQKNDQDMNTGTRSTRERRLRQKQQQEGLSSSSFVPWYDNQEDDRVMTQSNSWNNVFTGLQKKIHRVLMDRAALESVKSSAQRSLQVEDTNGTENDTDDGADGSTDDDDDGSIYDLLDEAQSQVSH
jgi:hypothetical protein